jgi:SAM-dependent methyltransferase
MPYSSDAFDSWLGSAISLLQPATVLDIGAGDGKYGYLAKRIAGAGGFSTRVKGVEIDESYIDRFKLRDIYDELVIGDAVDLINNPRQRFDLVIIGDCIEHMRKSAGLDLINFLVYRAGYICVIFPEALVQDDWEGHAAEAHISTWSAEDFRGWDTLHKTADLSWTKLHLFLIKGYQPSRATITS